MQYKAFKGVINLTSLQTRCINLSILGALHNDSICALKINSRSNISARSLIEFSTEIREV